MSKRKLAKAIKRNNRKAKAENKAVMKSVIQDAISSEDKNTKLLGYLLKSITNVRKIVI